MSELNYYTDLEMSKVMRKIMDMDEDFLEIIQDPKCQPEVKQKIIDLKEAYKALDYFGFKPYGFFFIGMRLFFGTPHKKPDYAPVIEYKDTSVKELVISVIIGIVFVCLLLVSVFFISKKFDNRNNTSNDSKKTEYKTSNLLFDKVATIEGDACKHGIGISTGIAPIHDMTFFVKLPQQRMDTPICFVFRSNISIVNNNPTGDPAELVQDHKSTVAGFNQSFLTLTSHKT